MGSLRSNPSGGNMEETSGQHLGALWEASGWFWHPGGTQEVARKHSGGIQEAPRETQATQRVPGDLGSKNSYPSLLNCKKILGTLISPWFLEIRCHQVLQITRQNVSRQLSRSDGAVKAPYLRPLEPLQINLFGESVVRDS